MMLWNSRMLKTEYDENLSDNGNHPSWYFLCDGFVLLFGYWTILCHITTFLDKNLNFLLEISLLSALLICTFLSFYKQAHPSPVKAPVNGNRSVNQRIQVVLFWMLVCSILVLTLIAHRSDADDNRYINRAVTIADNPLGPILKYDGRHGLPNVPVKITSKVYSNEVLAGTLSKLSGIPAIYFPHLMFSALAAILSVMAFGRLFRTLAPDYWAFAVLAVFIFLISDGAVHRTYGNFSLVRFHQGKGVVVSVMVPLIIVYAFDYMKKPTRKNWLLLLFVQIATLGFSSTGLLIAPFVSFFALMTYGAQSGKWFLRHRLLPGLLASIYILLILMVIVLYGQKQWPGRRALMGVTPPPQKKHAVSADVQPIAGKSKPNRYRMNTELVFGRGPFAVFYAFIILTAWIWAPTRLARWLCMVFPVGVAIVYLLPLTSKFVNYNFYWRIYWMLPLPVMAGLTLSAPLYNQWLLKRRPFMRYSVFILLLSITFFGISENNILAGSNHVHIGFPGLKVAKEYDIARYINDLLDNRPNVLVPSKVAVWIPSFHHHPYPLVSRYASAKVLGDEAPDRIALTRYIDGGRKPDNPEQFLGDQLERFQIPLVCFATQNRWREPIVKTLKNLGYEKQATISGYEIWLL